MLSMWAPSSSSDSVSPLKRCPQMAVIDLSTSNRNFRCSSLVIGLFLAFFKSDIEMCWVSVY